ncbi:DUF2746 domain-containing protein [Mycobacterium sp. pUA109]|uniref:DUF2746 domain-containing protein n=1 Tax=Mycobacterium sp. pUA109 TaxID=3238982 RepID=UPI00351B554B
MVGHPGVEGRGVNWPAVTLALVSLIGTVVVALAQVSGHKASKQQTTSADWKNFTDSLLATMGRVDGKVSEVREQVKNTHDSNLREDLDKVARLAESTAANVAVIGRQVTEVKDHVISHGGDISGIRKDMGIIRGELRDERRERIEGDRRADERRRRHGEPM